MTSVRTPSAGPGAWRTPVAALAAGTIILFVSFGARNIFGILLEPMTVGLGWTADLFSFAVALQVVLWGVTTPVAAALAERHGTARVVATGGVLYAGGLALLSAVETPLGMYLTSGLMLGFGLGATGFPIILAAVTRRVDRKRRSLFLGIGSAAGSSGQLALVPLGQHFIDGHGWAFALVAFGVMVAVIVPLSWFLAEPRPETAAPVAREPHQGIGEALREALGHRGFVLLAAGYFVCGFQILFLGTHLPNFLIEEGHDRWLGATALAIIGFANIVGTLGWGALGGFLRMKYLLTSIYLLRSAALTLFVLFPVTAAGTYAFSAVIGLLWLATVPLTSGLVARIFGLRYMATLTGIVFLSHQLGSFFGVWLGGLLFVDTGSYDAVWWISIALGLAAALLHVPIDDRPLARTARAAA